MTLSPTDPPWPYLVGVVAELLLFVYFVVLRRHPTGQKPTGEPFRITYNGDLLTYSWDLARKRGLVSQPTPSLPGLATGAGPVATPGLPGDVVPELPLWGQPAAPPVWFKPGEPRLFAEFGGQPHIIDYLGAAVAALGPTEQAIEPQLFLGPPGLGKSLLARVTSNELGIASVAKGLRAGEFIEAFGADIETTKDLDGIMRRVVGSPGCVLFIDEIHMVLPAHSIKLYAALADKRYHFAGEPNPIDLPPVTIIGATTDYGAMHGAFRRRFRNWNLQPASPPELVAIVRARPFPIAGIAADAIVNRTHWSGAPWEALELYSMGVTYAKAAQRTAVALADVERVFSAQQIDTLGLRARDRAVLRALFASPKWRRGPRGQPDVLSGYGMAETHLCSIANLDPADYRTSVKPRLMSRGLVTTQGGIGQALTAKGKEAVQQLAA